jgi:mannose-6-phosphate isomerase-like protein (cupin superfamily)
LSRVERDDASPSVASLVALCEVLNLDVGTLFSTPEVALVRPDTAPAINLGGTGVKERLMTPRSQSRLQLIHSFVDPGGNSGADMYTINCELEVLCVISGAVDLTFRHGAQRLETGDTLTFPGGEPHSWANRSEREPAELIWVLIPAPWSGSA